MEPATKALLINAALVFGMVILANMATDAIKGQMGAKEEAPAGT